MEQTTIINATAEYYQQQIADKDLRIQQLEEHIQRVTQRDYATRGELKEDMDRVMEALHRVEDKLDRILSDRRNQYIIVATV